MATLHELGVTTDPGTAWHGKHAGTDLPDLDDIAAAEHKGKPEAADESGLEAESSTETEPDVI